MAYTTIDKSSSHFKNFTWSGDGNNTRSFTGVGFQPDFSWKKERNVNYSIAHMLYDSVRGIGLDKHLNSASNAVEGDGNDDTFGYFSSFDTDGFSVQNGSSGTDYVNNSSNTYVTWNWLAGGTAPSQTYTVKVVSDGGNKYRFDDFGTSAVTLDLQEGGTYTFDASDSSVSSHPFVLGTSSGVDGSYSTGVTYQLDGVSKTYSQYTSGFASATTRKLIITVAASAPTLYYNCSVHSGMGGSINTNSTHGSSNFSGSVQTTVSTNTTAGMSVVKFTGTGSAATIGHGLGAVPTFIMVKRLSGATGEWVCHHTSLGNAKSILLNGAAASYTSSNWNSTTPTNSVISLGSGGVDANISGANYIAYCFASTIGFSKAGKFTSLGQDDGTFVYTGFKPSFVMMKPDVTDGWANWYIFDTARDHPSLNDTPLYPNLSTREAYYGGSPATNYSQIDMLSNGFKIRRDGSWGVGGSGQVSIYLAFGQTIVGSNNVPATAQ